jgi:excisionase family DNA binding protein
MHDQFTAPGSGRDEQSASPAAGLEDLSAAVANAVPAAFVDLPPLVGVPRAAKLLGISRAAAYRYVASGELRSRRLGSRVWVLASHLRELVRDRDAA